MDITGRKDRDYTEGYRLGDREGAAQILVLQELACQITKLGSSRILCEIEIAAPQDEHLYEVSFISPSGECSRTVDFDFALHYLNGAVDVLIALEEV